MARTPTPLPPWDLAVSRIERVQWSADTRGPTTPANLVATPISSTRIDLSWTASGDFPGGPLDIASGVASYRIYQNGSLTPLTSSPVNTVQVLSLNPSTTYTFRVDAIDAAGNVSASKSNVATATTLAGSTLFNPTFPRLGSYALSGTQAYADPPVIAAMAKRHVNIVTHFPGWQNVQGGGVSMASVCQQVKAQSAIGTRMYVYVMYSQVSKAAATAPSAFWETWQYATANTQFAYSNGLTHTGALDSQDGPTTAKFNFTTAIKPLVSGKTFAQWMLDWSKGLNYTGATISNGSSNRVAAVNTFWDGTFFDNVWQLEHVSADWDCNGVIESLVAQSTKNLIRTSHAVACDYFRLISPGQDCLANSAEWGDEPAFTTTALYGKYDGGVIEGGIGQSFSKEDTNSFSTYMAYNAVQMDAYIGAKLGVVVCLLPTLTDYRTMRYSLCATLMTNAYVYHRLTIGQRSQDLPSLWFDEYDFNLGAPLDPEQTAPRFLGGGNAANGEGYWVRDFVNGRAICTAKRGGGHSDVADQETPYTSYALGGTFFRLNGTQDPTTNSGAAVTSVQMKPRDGLVLLRAPADTQAPTTPTNLLVTSFTSTQVSMTWGASTDTGGSGLGGYKIERSSNGGSSYSQVGTSAVNSFSDTTVAASTSYIYRVRAYDNATPTNNNSNYSNTQSVTTPALNRAPQWDQTFTAVGFTLGTPATFSVAAKVTDPDGDAMALTKNAVVMQAGVTFNGTNYVYDGTGVAGTTTGHVVDANDRPTTGDWLLRSTAAGVVKAAALATAGELVTYAFAGTETTPPALDVSIAPFGQTASTKFTVANADGTQSGTLKIPFGQTFGNGKQVWISIRERMPPEFAYMVAPTSDNSVQGFKQMIVSGINNTNQAFEVVWESNFQYGIVLGYNNSNNGFNNWQQSYNPPTGFDLRAQPSIFNDVAATKSPDSVYDFVNGGTDPDTGALFSSAQIEWSRIGGSYNSQQNDTAFAFGLGHPLGGGVRYPVNQFATYTYCIDVGVLGTASSRIRAWVAPEGQAYIKLTDVSGVKLDQDVDAGFNCGYPMPYYTNRTPGGKSVASRTNNITGVTVRVVGLGTAAGAGTLSWNATTKRLTWTEAGGTAGTARGCASWKRWVNVTSGGTANRGYSNAQQLGLEINFAALPATNQTDTITIQNSRPNTQTNKAEFLVSSQPINATAFNAAGVQVGPTGGYVPT